MNYHITPQFLISFRPFPSGNHPRLAFPLIAPTNSLPTLPSVFISCASCASVLHFLYVIWSRFAKVNKKSWADGGKKNKGTYGKMQYEYVSFGRYIGDLGYSVGTATSGRCMGKEFLYELGTRRQQVMWTKSPANFL
jgi:hypothetical protein